MTLILNIDTTAENAFIAVAADGNILASAFNGNMKDHASFLHPAIEKTLLSAGVKLAELDAIAVNHGPGSYTGIRVGVAAAKGCCYALKKPLIATSALEILAADAIMQIKENALPQSAMVCPLIDARRMEVFTALYDYNLNLISPPNAQILYDDFLVKSLLTNNIIFIGNGASKWQAICKSQHAIFIDVANSGLSMSTLSYQHFEARKFSDLALTEPLYLKEFYSGQNVG